MTPPVDEAVTEALGHLQRAVLEMIQAARATLDLVEDMVAEPQSLAAIVATVGHLAQAVVAAASARRLPEEGPAPAASPSADASRVGVERIPVV